MFKKKVPITETPEFKAQAEQLANSQKVDSVSIGKNEPPKEVTLQDQVLAMTDTEFRTLLVQLLVEVRAEVQFVREVAESELK
jgi:hypothetical protein